MPRKPIHLKRDDWATKKDLWHGLVEGKDIGTGVTVLFFATEEVGHRPRWHVYPYDEIFIIRTGRALFTIGDKKIEAAEGQILLGPADVPHKYVNLGPGLLESTDIHVISRPLDPDRSG